MEPLTHHNKIDSRAVSYASIGCVSANASSAITFSAKCINPQVSPIIRPTSSSSTSSQHLINDEQVESGTFVNATCTISTNADSTHNSDNVNVNNSSSSHHNCENVKMTNVEESKELCNDTCQHVSNGRDNEDQDWLADEELDMFDIELQREFQSELNSDKVHVFGVNGEQVHIPRLPLGAGATIELVHHKVDESRPNNYWSYTTGDNIVNSNSNSNEHRYHYEQHHHVEDDVNYKNEVTRSKSATKNSKAFYSQSLCNECNPPVVTHASSSLESLRRINGLQNGSLSPGVPTPPLASPFQFANSYNYTIDKSFCGNNNNTNKFVYNTNNSNNNNGNGNDNRNASYGNYYSANSYSPPFAGCMSYIEQLIHAKQFPSFANTCQMSNITSNRDETARVVHHLANELRKELHVPHNNNNNNNDTLNNVEGSVFNSYMTHSRSNSSSNTNANKKNTFSSSTFTPPAQSQSQQTASFAKKVETNITITTSPAITTSNTIATNTNTDTNNIVNTTEEVHATPSQSPHAASAILPSLSPRTNNLEDDLALLMLFLQEVAHNYQMQIPSPSSPNLVHTARSNANSNSIMVNGAIHNNNNININNMVNNNNHHHHYDSAGISTLARMDDNGPFTFVPEIEMEHVPSKSNYHVQHGSGFALHSHSLTPTSAHATHRSRSTPAITGANASTQRNIRPGSSSNHNINNNGGRSTIDSEVTDSLNRLHVMGSSTCAHKEINGNVAANSQFIVHEHELYRPINPYQGVSHGAYTTPQQLPQTQYPSEFAYWSHNQTNLPHVSGCNNSQPAALPNKKNELNEIAVLHHINSSIVTSNNNNNNNNYPIGRENVPLSVLKANDKMYNNNSNTVNNNNKLGHHTLHSPHQTISSNMNTIAASASSSVGRKANRTNNAVSSVVAHPRAVKPGVSKGKSRGPRSQSGKNVSPSNHSVFSECSGGETRSYQSTNTILRHNTSLSLNATTNTSLSSTTTTTISYPIREMGNSRGSMAIMHDKESSNDIFINSNNNSNNNICSGGNNGNGDAVLIENGRSVNAFINCSVANNVGKATRARTTMNSANNIGLSGMGSVNTLMEFSGM